MSFGKARVALCLMLLLALASAPTLAASQHKLEKKMANAADVFTELLDTPDKRIPNNLLERSRCVAVIPRVIKAAFGFGGRHGTGVISCRELGGGWSAPSFVTLSGGSFGFQIGAQSTDHVLFFMTERGSRSMLKSKVALGADASVAAGPVGRTAEATTDIKFDAAIYSYAKAKGLFAGISLEGAVLRASKKKNRQYYGQDYRPEAILFESQIAQVPEGAQRFRSALPREVLQLPETLEQVGDSEVGEILEDESDITSTDL